GHLGHAVTAAGAIGDAGPGVEPGLLRLAGIHAAVNGAGRSAVENHWRRGYLHRRRDSSTGPGRHRDGGRRNAPRRTGAPVALGDAARERSAARPAVLLGEVLIDLGI